MVVDFIKVNSFRKENSDKSSSLFQCSIAMKGIGSDKEGFNFIFVPYLMVERKSHMVIKGECFNPVSTDKPNSLLDLGFDQLSFFWREEVHSGN